MDVLGDDDLAPESAGPREDLVDQGLHALGVGVALPPPLSVGLEHHDVVVVDEPLDPTGQTQDGGNVLRRCPVARHQHPVGQIRWRVGIRLGVATAGSRLAPTPAASPGVLRAATVTATASATWAWLLLVRIAPRLGQDRPGDDRDAL